MNRSARYSLEDLERLRERFWSYVNIAGPDDCWPWKGVLAKGYGRFRIGKHKSGSHRVAWELTNNKLLGSKFACHECDNPLCCNPKHIYEGDHLTNQRDKNVRNRNARGDRHGSKTKPHRIFRGEQVSRSKFTAELVLEFRRQRAAGKKYRQIALEYGYSESGVWAAINGHTWKHI